MELIVHQLLCGEKDKAFSLLRTTLQNKVVARNLAFKSDLEDKPSGTSWKPNIRGFIVDDYFLIMKTYPDNSKIVRRGRVFSHVLAISKNQLNQVYSIESLLRIFPEEINKEIEIKPIKYIHKKEYSLKFLQELKPRFNKAVHGLYKQDKYRNTTIWIGQDNFEKATSQLWSILSFEQKRNLNFGIYFNPSQVPEGKINFISTTEASESKFLNSPYNVIRKNENYILTEFAEQYLGRDDQAINRIEQFKEKIKANKIPQTEVVYVAKIIETFENLEKTDDIKRLITLASIIAKYSPDNKKGVKYKAKLLQKIISNSINESGEDLLRLRFFKIECYSESKTKLTAIVEEWLEKNLFDLKRNTNNDYSIFLQEYFKMSPRNWWTDSVEKKLIPFLFKLNSTSIKILLKWLKKDFKIFFRIKDLIDNSNNAELLFIKHFSSNFKKNYDSIKIYCKDREWYKLFATVLKIEKTFEKAIEEYLQFDQNPKSIEGIEILISGVKQNIVIDFALLNGDKRLIEKSGLFCKENSKLLNRITVTDLNWQKIWLSAIKHGNSLIQGLINPKQQIFEIYNSFLNGNKIESRLLQKISESEFANILDYPKRGDIWNKLPSNIKSNFLKKTAAFLLKSLSQNEVFPIPNDKVLSKYISNFAISDFLYFNRNNFKVVLPIFEIYKDTPEEYLLNYVHNYSGSIDVIDSVRLGKLVYEHQLNSIAHELYRKTSSHIGFKGALSECYQLFNLYNRVKVGLTRNISFKVSKNEWWDNFQELTIKLYPSPMAGIWAEAGGEESDLKVNGTGKEVWLDALKKLRKNRFSNITVEKLLSKMIDENPQNENLKILKDLWKKKV